MKRAVSLAEPEPLAAINITPLIDVMLVLLVMLIITIPAVTHKLPVELPGDGAASTTPAMPHRLDISATGGLSWDGRSIRDHELAALLRSTVAGHGTLAIKTDQATRYERFNAVLNQVKRAGVTRLGFVGNEAMRF